MTPSLQRVIDGKRAYRRHLAKLPPAEKLRLLEQLRHRAQTQKGSCRSPSPPLPPSVNAYSKVDQQVEDSSSTRTVRSSPCKLAPHRFGGRATASGVSYEVRVAALIAVKMLLGRACVVWDGINGADISGITMQAPESVDDIVVTLSRDSEARVFVSAKERSSTIALTARSAVFTETIDAFVSQFLKLPVAVLDRNRLVWAVPSCAGRGIAHNLLTVLNTHRRQAGDTGLSEFCHGRQAAEKKVLEALLAATRKAWNKQTGKLPIEDELRSFLRMLYVEVYDFSSGQQLERQAESDLRAHVLEDAEQAKRAWEKVEHLFATVDQHGLHVTPASLRRTLAAEGLKLQAPRDFAPDLKLLSELTARNLSELREHTTLSFGREPGDAIHIPRTVELTSLLSAAKSGHLLLTGEPGCGKSGLLHTVVEALQKDGHPVVLLLAEELCDRDSMGSANLLDLAHSLDEILANWPDGTRGFFVTDALDAVRDIETQKKVRRLFGNVQKGTSGWTVIASVREFDLQFGRELREAFPGVGVAGHSSTNFLGVAHFHLARFSEAQLDDLAARRTEILPFIKAARGSTKSEGIHLSPFYLRLAAELLRDGAPPSRLADWASPALLMRKFWGARVKGQPGEGDRERALEAISQRMVEARTMAVSAKELRLGALERNAINELRQRGILRAPAWRHGAAVGSDELRFTHHLLHDYAIARSLIPETPGPFCDFTIRHPLLPIFYRQSFIFALEEVWDADDQREGFWEVTLRLESAPQLHGLTRIVAPLLAARRVEAPADLEPLLRAIDSLSDLSSSATAALRHLAAGLQEAPAEAIRLGATGWCSLAEQLGKRLPAGGFLEQPLALILDRLNSVTSGIQDHDRLALNAAGIGLLAVHLAKGPKKGWRYGARVAIETVCRTFASASARSERALLSLLTPERLVHFPHDDLFDLANNLQHLGDKGGSVVIKLFEAAFGSEPAPGQWEQEGSIILPMRIQTSDQWNSVRHVLADYYKGCSNQNAALMTEAACIVWNAVVRRRTAKQETSGSVLATIQFRGIPCPLIEDYSHLWSRVSEPEENRILCHFEKLLRQWTATDDTPRIAATLDCFAATNRTALLWTVLMEAGAEYPLSLGSRLSQLLVEPLFLTHPDYAFGGAALLGTLHKVGDRAQRERLEKLIVELPKKTQWWDPGSCTVRPDWLEDAQNRLLNVLEEPNIVLEPVRDLWRRCQSEGGPVENRSSEGSHASSLSVSNEELAKQNTASSKGAMNKDLSRLREALNPLLDRNRKLDPQEVERRWPVIIQCERALEQHAVTDPKMATELWGYLVGASANIATHVASWSKPSKRWERLRRILLRAAKDPVPEVEDDDAQEDGTPVWGWPSPRVDAACGLPFIFFRLGRADKAIAAALRRLCRDQSHAVRFNLAVRLAVLDQVSPVLMWELIDAVFASEKRFSVLDGLLYSMNQLWARGPAEIMLRLNRIADRVMQEAPAGHPIHETLLHTYLFHFLRTGDPECEAFVANIIAECDSQRACNALGAQLHLCRKVKWLTLGDPRQPDSPADGIRARTWGFFSKVLGAAQEKLQQHRADWHHLHEHGQPNAETAKALSQKLDRAANLVDGVALQLYFASGAFDEKTNERREALTSAQLRRFWQEAHSLLASLANEPHPHTARQVVNTLCHLLPCAPQDVFLLAARSIVTSANQANFQYESLAVADVVKLIQRVLADHRDLFQGETAQESACLKALLQVLDLFVEAGWPEARRLTHRLEEIYR